MGFSGNPKYHPIKQFALNPKDPHPPPPIPNCRGFMYVRYQLSRKNRRIGLTAPTPVSPKTISFVFKDLHFAGNDRVGRPSVVFRCRNFHEPVGARKPPTRRHLRLRHLRLGHRLRRRHRSLDRQDESTDGRKNVSRHSKFGRCNLVKDFESFCQLSYEK